MATLQKFKLLALQCGVAPSPTRSPRTSPLVQFRRRKTTLKMLLCRSTSRRSPRRRESPLQLKHLLDSPHEKENEEEEEKSKDLMRRHSLKDLFVSALPTEEEEEEAERNGEISESERRIHYSRALDSARNMDLVPGLGSPKPGWSGLRCRSLLLRRGWRPVLVTIPE